MPETVSLGLPLLVAEQAQKHVTHNEALRALDALVQLSVKDRDLAAPPGSPAEGDRYIVAASPTGVWAGHATDIAVWQDGAWDFHAPNEGWQCWLDDENALLVFDGSAWSDWSAALGELQNLSLLGVGTTADATNPFSAKLNKALWTAKYASEGGDGDLRYTLNKETTSDVLSLLFQKGFSERAEIGLIGDDDLSFKTSPDGSSFNVGLALDKTTGGVRFLASQIDVASAAICDIGAAASLKIRITGTTTITSFGTVPHAVKIILFNGALTLTHNATSLILPGGVNIVTAAGDCAIATSDSSGSWRVREYQKATGKAVIASALSDVTASGALGLVDWTDIASAATTDLGSVASNFVRITGTTTITGLGTAAATVWRFVRFAAALTLTHNATSLILPGGANIATAAGDCGLFKSEGSGNWRCLAYWKASGKAVIGPASTDITDSTSTGRSAITAANAAALATAAGVGTGDSPTHVALTLSNGQLAFPATQAPSADPNTLDDYEEGTFTPTMASTGGGTPTYSTQAGYYTKVGNAVHFEARVILATAGTLTTGSMSVNGLPFTSDSTADHYTACTMLATALGSGATTMTLCIISPNATKVLLFTYAAGTASTLPFSQITGTTSVTIHGTYKV